MVKRSVPVVIGLLVLSLVIAVAVGFAWLNVSPPDGDSNDKKATSSTGAASSSPQAAVQEKRGEVTTGPNKTSTYFIQHKDGDSRYAALFQPPLPRNDGILTFALLQLIGESYGKHTVTNLTPQLVPMDGVNYIMFEGTQGNYYMLISKEDTGEVNAVTYFRK